jgi:hypothetical protein
MRLGSRFSASGLASEPDREKLHQVLHAFVRWPVGGLRGLLLPRPKTHYTGSDDQVRDLHALHV